MLKYLIKSTIAFLCLSVLPSLGFAVPPTGQFEFIISESKIWDISGSYSEDFDGIDIDYILVTDEAGKITGSGTAFASLFGATVNADLIFNGSIKSSREVTRIKLKFTMIGDVSDGVENFFFTAKVKAKLEINEATHSALGSAKARICIEGNGCVREVASFDFLLEGDMDGSWVLTLDLSEAENNKLTGTGMITLSNNREITTIVSGKYSSKKETVKLKLKNSKGTKFSLKSLVQGAILEIVKLKGKSLGQKQKLQ